MLLFLGVRTQSEESIRLCYMMDLEAFNMMEADNFKKYYDVRYNYLCVYKNLLDELNYEILSQEEKDEVEEVCNLIDLDEEDKEFRDKYFTGLERTLLRYNHFELISFQPYKENDEVGNAVNAYLYELKKEFEEAIKLYSKIGLQDRIDICKRKMEYM